MASQTSGFYNLGTPLDTASRQRRNPFGSLLNGSSGIFSDQIAQAQGSGNQFGSNPSLSGHGTSLSSPYASSASNTSGGLGTANWANGSWYSPNPGPLEVAGYMSGTSEPDWFGNGGGSYTTPIYANAPLTPAGQWYDYGKQLTQRAQNQLNTLIPVQPAGQIPTNLLGAYYDPNSPLYQDWQQWLLSGNQNLANAAYAQFFDKSKQFDWDTDFTEWVNNNPNFTLDQKNELLNYKDAIAALYFNRNVADNITGLANPGASAAYQAALAKYSNTPQALQYDKLINQINQQAEASLIANVNSQEKASNVRQALGGLLGGVFGTNSGGASSGGNDVQWLSTLTPYLNQTAPPTTGNTNNDNNAQNLFQAQQAVAGQAVGYIQQTLAGKGFTGEQINQMIQSGTWEQALTPQEQQLFGDIRNYGNYELTPGYYSANGQWISQAQTKLPMDPSGRTLSYYLDNGSPNGGQGWQYRTGNLLGGYHPLTNDALLTPYQTPYYWLDNFDFNQFLSNKPDVNPQQEFQTWLDAQQGLTPDQRSAVSNDYQDIWSQYYNELNNGTNPEGRFPAYLQGQNIGDLLTSIGNTSNPSLGLQYWLAQQNNVSSDERSRILNGADAIYNMYLNSANNNPGQTYMNYLNTTGLGGVERIAPDQNTQQEFLNWVSAVPNLTTFQRDQLANRYANVEAQYEAARQAGTSPYSIPLFNEYLAGVSPTEQLQQISQLQPAYGTTTRFTPTVRWYGY